MKRGLLTFILHARLKYISKRSLKLCSFDLDFEYSLVSVKDHGHANDHVIEYKNNNPRGDARKNATRLYARNACCGLSWKAIFVFRALT